MTTGMAVLPVNFIIMAIKYFSWKKKYRHKKAYLRYNGYKKCRCKKEKLHRKTLLKRSIHKILLGFNPDDVDLKERKSIKRYWSWTC